jgi:hypothetical protein
MGDGREKVDFFVYCWCAGVYGAGFCVVMRK